ncbi:MAG TPA: hypothetical protein VKD91_19860 [Pyrinomonadaceae bacterium]|nr:hypothetical protein [Pyrinomonadaceae bacterium]
MISETVSNELDLECITVLNVDNIILKSQFETVIFSAPMYTFTGTTSGSGKCGPHPFLPGGINKCYPIFEATTVGQCLNPTANCLRWQRNVWDQDVQCIYGEFYPAGLCTCHVPGTGTVYSAEHTCPTPGCCGAIADFITYPSTGCQSGFVYNGSICDRSQTFQNQCAEPTGYDPETCSCPDGVNPSPIIVDVDHSGFSLTDAARGVVFDILNDGVPLQLAWTTSSSTNAFLVLDRNGNGTIDNGAELFGNLTPQPPSSTENGFLALAEYDKAQNGGNGDGTIDNRDTVFANLRLWQDRNHNGVSEPNELHKLTDLGLNSIDLDFKESRRVDEYGNQFRFRSKVKDNHGNQLGRWAWDVFLMVQQ